MEDILYRVSTENPDVIPLTEIKPKNGRRIGDYPLALPEHHQDYHHYHQDHHQDYLQDYQHLLLFLLLS